MYVYLMWFRMIDMKKNSAKFSKLKIFLFSRYLLFSPKFIGFSPYTSDITEYRNSVFPSIRPHYAWFIYSAASLFFRILQGAVGHSHKREIKKIDSFHKLHWFHKQNWFFIRACRIFGGGTRFTGIGNIRVLAAYNF